ncbi:FAD-dependent oxidoreductase [Nocardia sp. CA2R105]|uniref:GMC family oxidoreductase n=1 Tax=Nocardia coffeae TaxID=2873381 RepID=UPI001CA6A241|nr:GMC family oxidoreductase N-terminal domain-containing protein [Nocardia coffeae]MBY8858679.1 FAD-dependent oxidoreductase [Nocardia coffeae]
MAENPIPKIAPFHDPADVVVVGGGSAGCVMAARLTEDPSVRVVLLEAGAEYDQSGPNELTELYGGKAVLRPKYYWPGLTGTTASPSRFPGGKPPRVSYKQPRLLGGGSSVNGQVAFRGAPDDFDAWAKAGARGWGWDDVLPYFIKLEHDLDFCGPLHGQDGPTYIRRTPREEWDSVSLAVSDALVARGHQYIDDMNGEFAAGHGAVPLNNDGELRSSVVRAYLTPAVRARPNLRVLTEVEVTRIRTEGKRAVGVEATSEGAQVFVPARHVIVTAGAINSPALLLRSGIGDGAVLAQLGVEVVADRPGVGRNLQNHPMTSVSAYTEPKGRRVRPQRRVFSYLRYSSGVEGCAAEDMVLSTGARSMWHAIGQRIVTLSPYVAMPYSTGTVSLASADPAVNPVIDNNCLADERDLVRLREGFRFSAAVMLEDLYPKLVSMPFPTHLSWRVEKLGKPTLFNDWFTRVGAAIMDSSSAARNFLLDKVVREGPTVAQVLADDKLLDEFLSKRVNLAWHHSCTARMGAEDDPEAVVDPSCAVIGLEGLYIADASVMPRITRTNLNLPTIMVAERAADLIRARVRPGFSQGAV